MSARSLPRAISKVRVLVAYRSATLASPREALRYLVHDRETTNFTYDIRNRDDLAAFLASRFQRPFEQTRALIAEADQDRDLLRRLESRLRTRRDRNNRAFFGRRLGWYVTVRILRPALVVETGVHDGLGSALLSRALERNEHDGFPGRLLGFDLDPASGWLLDDELATRFDLVVGDVRTTLPQTLAGREVGVFIHDSAHTYTHERFELDVVERHAARGAALLSDNAHASTALADFARERGLDYGFFAELPRNHFYPGAGIGLVLLR